jgi:hypothetical protein
MYKKNGNQWLKIGQTEVIHDNLNPKFVTKIPCQYNFELNDQFKVDVYDIDDDSQINNTDKHDHLGTLEFTLHEVVTSRDQTLYKRLVQRQGSHKSHIRIIAEDVKDNANSEMLTFNPHAQMKSPSGPYFFIVYKSRGQNQWTPLYKSEVKKPRGNVVSWA